MSMNPLITNTSASHPVFRFITAPKLLPTITAYRAVKRTMAGEYSRELSVKLKARLIRLTRMGYEAGSCLPYGMRRMLLDVHGKPKRLLADGAKEALQRSGSFSFPFRKRKFS